jgi:1,4-dihydroxy-2-naphthoate octaprenyltransferase
MKSVLLWLRIVRPQTLPASLCPVVVGLACSPAPLHEGVAWVTVFCALGLQILSNLINDYYDFLRGTDRKARVGFRRALAEGEVTGRQMRIAILVCLALTVALGMVLVLCGGWRILLIGLTALLFAWLYTATSRSLSYLGIADIFVWLYYGVVASVGTTWLQVAMTTSPVTSYEAYMPSFWAGSVCGLISMLVLMINNIRDIDSDREAGKRTLPVRLGKRAAEGLMFLIILGALACAYIQFGFSPVLFTALPLTALWIAVLRARGKTYNLCLLGAGICNICYTILVLCVQ